MPTESRIFSSEKSYSPAAATPLNLTVSVPPSMTLLPALPVIVSLPLDPVTFAMLASVSLPRLCAVPAEELVPFPHGADS